MRRDTNICRVSTELAKSVLKSRLDANVLSFVILVKGKFSSSAVNDATYQKLGRIAGIAPQTAKKYLERALALGWVTVTDNNQVIAICLYDRSKRSYRYTSRIITYKNCTLRHVRNSLLVDSLQRQDHMVRLYATRRKIAAKRSRRKGRGKVLRTKSGSVHGGQNIRYHDQGIAFSTLARLWGCSITTAQYYIKQLVEDDRIRKHVNRIVIHTGPNSEAWFWGRVNPDTTNDYTPLDRTKRNKMRIHINVPMKIILNKKKNAVLAVLPNTYSFNTEKAIVSVLCPRYEGSVAVSLLKPKAACQDVSSSISFNNCTVNLSVPNSAGFPAGNKSVELFCGGY